MRTRLTYLVCSLCVVVLLPASARALDQSVHFDITEAACDAVGGFHGEFCERLGDEAYNVDRDEWYDPAAHAVPALGQSRCDAANAVLGRLQALGTEVRDVLHLPTPSRADADRLARSMGRMFHTIQDNCGHHGVPEPQHSWWSFKDSCEGTATSPDVQPGVLACAEAETLAVLQELSAQVQATGFPAAALSHVDSVRHGWPPRAGVCEFLGLAATWDGQDGSWDNAIMLPALRTEFTDAMKLTSPPPVGDFCNGDPAALLPATLAQTVDTSVEPDWCLKLSVYCIGKADAPDEAAPWSADQESGSSGCSVRGDGGADPAWLGLAVLLGLVWRRRRRSPRSGGR